MTIEVLSFPASIYPSTQRLTPAVGGGQGVQESAFSGVQTVMTYRGSERWKLEMSFDGLTGDDRADMMAFITRLRISHNVFLCVQHTAPQRGVRTGTPLILGSLNGHWANMYNVPTLINSYLRAGDFISINSQLKMLLEDAGSDVSGICSAHIWPPFYDVPASGSIVVVNSPCGAFRLVSEVAYTTNPPRYVTDLTISAVERVNSSMVGDFL